MPHHTPQAKNSGDASLPAQSVQSLSSLCRKVQDGLWSSSGTRIQGLLSQKLDPFPGQIILRSTACSALGTDHTLEKARMQGLGGELLLTQRQLTHIGSFHEPLSSQRDNEHPARPTGRRWALTKLLSHLSTTSQLCNMMEGSQITKRLPGRLQKTCQGEDLGYAGFYHSAGELLAPTLSSAGLSTNDQSLPQPRALKVDASLPVWRTPGCHQGCLPGSSL